jgi:hypothetical protein
MRQPLPDPPCETLSVCCLIPLKATDPGLNLPHRPLRRYIEIGNDGLGVNFQPLDTID